MVDQGPCPCIVFSRYTSSSATAPVDRRNRGNGRLGRRSFLQPLFEPITSQLRSRRCKSATDERRLRCTRRVHRGIRLFRERSLRMRGRVGGVVWTVRRHRVRRPTHLWRKATAVDARCARSRIVLRPNNSRRAVHLAHFDIILLVLGCAAPTNDTYG